MKNSRPTLAVRRPCLQPAVISHHTSRLYWSARSSALESFWSRLDHQSQLYSSISGATMSGKDTQDLDARAAAGETVVTGGTGGKSLDAQQHLAKGRSKGGQARAEQLGHEGYVEMGKKGGSATDDMSGGEAADATGRDIDESKFTN